jgi:hypothetical protein
LERTPEWIEPIKERTKKLNPKDSEFEDMLAQLKVSSEDRPVREITTLKSKVKTKGTAQAGNVPAPEATLLDHEQPPSQAADIQPTMKVTKRALKVFSTLFHTPSQPDQPGEIPWQDFLHAMASTGFVPSKLYGSIWQFTPTTLDVERSIQFHEPHPRGKIPFRWARRIGRRLNRAYGWHSGMFVLG